MNNFQRRIMQITGIPEQYYEDYCATCLHCAFGDGWGRAEDGELICPLSISSLAKTGCALNRNGSQEEYRKRLLKVMEGACYLVDAVKQRMILQILHDGTGDAVNDVMATRKSAALNRDLKSDFKKYERKKKV